MKDIPTLPNAVRNFSLDKNDPSVLIGSKLLMVFLKLYYTSTKLHEIHSF